MKSFLAEFEEKSREIQDILLLRPPYLTEVISFKIMIEYEELMREWDIK